MKNYSKLFEITIGNIPLHFVKHIFFIWTLNTFFFWTYVQSSFTIISDVNSLNVIQPNNIIIIHQKKNHSLLSLLFFFHLQATNNLHFHSLDIFGFDSSFTLLTLIASLLKYYLDSLTIFTNKTPLIVLSFTEVKQGISNITNKNNY